MPPLSSLHRLRLPGLALTILLLALAVVPATAAPAPLARLFGPPAARAACGLPLVHDHYVGFHIGVPAGWDLSTFNGAIAVSKDSAGTEAALLYPALLTKGLTPARFFAAARTTVQQIAAAAGSTLTFHLTSQPGQLPQASVTARVGVVSEQGHAAILVVPAQTALAVRQVVFAVYWAPPARLAAERARLARIAACYGPEPGTLYRLYQDQVFAFALPVGWQVADEGQDSIDLVGDARHALAGYLLTLLPASAGVTTPRSLLTYVFGQAHIRLDRILWSTDGPRHPQANGAVQQQEIVEFTGQYNGNAVHGLASVLSDAGSAVTTGVLRLGLARVDQWNAVNSGLIRVMTGIQHKTTQDQAQWAHVTQQWEKFDQTTQQFDNVIRGVQDVQDPATGTVYEAPYDTYRPTGPDGPGYYLDQGGTLVKLQPLHHQ
jgi:hypothetical protein